MSKLSNIMSEKIPPQIEKPRSELPIEQQANFEGSWTNLMCERLRNPEIRKQVIDLIFEIEQSADGRLYKKMVSDDSGVYYKKYGKRYSFVEARYVARTREQVEKDFENDLEMVSNDTPISFNMEDENGNMYPRFDADIPEGREIFPVNMMFHPVTSEKYTDKMLNISESHEKGHVLRRYSFAGSRKNDLLKSTVLDEKFQNTFDFEAIDPPSISYKYEDGYEKSKSFKRTMKETKERQKRTAAEYLRDPCELTERMSQLKNYFGMNSAERFTKEHLAYAREHFIKDTEVDNAMTYFFQSITPEKEDAFIELINSAGI